MILLNNNNKKKISYNHLKWDLSYQLFEASLRYLLSLIIVFFEMDLGDCFVVESIRNFRWVKGIKNLVGSKI